MKKLLFFLALALSAQQIKINPFTGLPDMTETGGFTAPSGYSAAVTAQTTTTVTAATHGQGTAPLASCFDNATPANAVACSYTVSSIGDVVFTWSPAFTGTVIIRGPGAGAGAAGDVVGPASSTTNKPAFFSGTSGKIIAEGTTSGNTTAVVTTTGTQTNGRCVEIDANGNHIAAAGACGGTAGVVLLETEVASSSASLDFTSCVSSTYDTYKIELLAVVPATDNVTINVLFSTNGGMSYDTSAIYDGTEYRSTLVGGTFSGYNNAAAIGLGRTDNISNAANSGLSGTLTLQALNNGLAYPFIQGMVSFQNPTGNVQGNGHHARYRNTTSINAVRFIPSSGVITSGTIRCYGIAK